MPSRWSLRSLLPSCLGGQSVVTEEYKLTSEVVSYRVPRTVSDGGDSACCSAMLHCISSASEESCVEVDQQHDADFTQFKVNTRHLQMYTVRLSDGMVRFCRDGELQGQLPLHALCRAAVLAYIFSGAEYQEDTEIALPLPEGVLHTWIHCLSTLNIVDREPAADWSEIQGYALIDMIQAADFLCDRESLDRLVAKASEWLFNANTAENKSAAFSTIENCCLALQRLPEDVICSILTADSRHMYKHLQLLPKHMHYTAMHAYFPSLTHTSTLHLPIPKSDNLMHALGPLIASTPELQGLTLSGDYAPKTQCMPCDDVLRWKHLSHVVNLRNLTLRKVSLGGSSDSDVCKWLLKLSKLQHLDLSDSAVRRYHGAPMHAEGQHLFPRYVDSLSALTALTSINLRGNYIGRRGAKELSEGIQHLTNLKKLCLAGNQLGSEGISFLAPNLSNVGALEDLDVSHNDIREGIHFLYPVLPTLPSLNHLNLSNNVLFEDSSPSVCWFTPGLLRMPRLLSLDLGANGMANNDLRLLAQNIRELGGLQTLVLAGNSFDWALSSLMHHLKHLSALKELDCGGNDLSCAISSGNFSVLSQKTGLTRLCLRESRIRSIGASNPESTFALLYSLRRLVNLRSLDLSGVSLNARLADKLPSTMAALSRLEHLDLSYTGIRKCALLFVLATTNLPNIQTMNLAGIVPGKPVAWGAHSRIIRDLGEVLVKFQTLRRLDLSDNYIGPSSICVVESLSALTLLTLLRVVGCDIESHLSPELVQQVRRFPALEVLDVHGDGGIPLSDHDWRYFAHGLDG